MRDLVGFDGFGQVGGDVFSEDLEGFGTGREALPLPLDAGSFEDADNGLRNFGADAVARDQGYFVSFGLSHCFSLVGLVVVDNFIDGISKSRDDRDDGREDFHCKIDGQRFSCQSEHAVNGFLHHVDAFRILIVACCLFFGLSCPVAIQQAFQFFLEFAHVFEIAVDRGEADVGYRVEAFEMVHDQFAHFAGGAFALGSVD